MIIVTGYSQKEDGLLIVAESLEEAALAVDCNVVRCGNNCYFVACGCSADIHEEDAPYWHTWKIESQEIKENTNLYDAVQW